MKAIFSTNADSFLVDDARVEAFVDFVGPGIFSSNGEAWQHHRALVRPSFVRANVEDTRPLEEHVRNLLISVPPNGTTFDLQVLFFRYTIDYSTDILFSASSKDDSVARDRFVEAFDYATKYATKRLMLGKLRTCLPDPQYADSKRVMREYTAKYVRRALEKPGSDDRYSFVREMAKETQDEDALRSELCNILLAARDTTASLLSNLFHVLARRPDVVAKLRVEVDSLRGKLPSASELKKLKYLQDTLAECEPSIHSYLALRITEPLSLALRLHSVVPLNSRFTSKPTVLPRGGGPKGTSPIVLDKGDRVFTDLYSMNHRHDLFGPDADEFVPERWQRKELSGQLGWAFIPFSGGPRICLGQQMAMIEAGYVTARLLQEFVRIEPRDERPWQEDFNMIMGSGNGTKVAMWRKT